MQVQGGLQSLKGLMALQRTGSCVSSRKNWKASHDGTLSGGHLALLRKSTSALKEIKKHLSLTFIQQLKYRIKQLFPSDNFSITSKGKMEQFFKINSGK